VSWAATGETVKVQVVGTAAVQWAPGATVQLAGTPTVQARATRQTWEYRQITIVAGQDATAALNTAGNDGWETTGITLPASGATAVILKRPR
jgi:hypothetical protein